MKRTILTNFLCIIALTSIVGQYSDCETALLIQDKSSLFIENSTGIGNIEENYTNLCLPGSTVDFESNSYWIRFRAYSTGTLYFSIYPEDLEDPDDLDFFLFTSPSASCADMENLRCVATSCQGPTGLDTLETDHFETLNCDTLSENGFVSHIELYEGDTYYLMINNFSESGKSYHVDFCGTGLIGPDDIACPQIISTSELNNEYTIEVFPNPNDGSFYITGINQDSHLEVVLTNNLGQKSKTYDLKNQRLVNADLKTGIYYLQIFTDGKYLTSKKIMVN